MLLNLESSVIVSPCPLLPAEVAEDFLPQAFMPVPRDSAWVPLELDLAGHLDSRGEFDLAKLEAALRLCVDEGERLHDSTEWAGPLLEYDSWLNRRLAIAVRGIGDVVAIRGDDPATLNVLRELEQLVEWVCRTLHQYSQSLAAGRNWCPAIDQAGALTSKIGLSKRWSGHWKRAVQSVAVRHRNLTTISPWDVFPRGKRAEMRYSDLLPLTRFADSLSFQCETDISGWNANEFKGFQERVSAIARSGRGAGLIAKQV